MEADYIITRRLLFLYRFLKKISNPINKIINDLQDKPVRNYQTDCVSLL